MDVGTIIVLVALVGLVMFAVGVYNRLIAARNFFKNAFAQIDVQLKRRYDLIPNLVETAKGYLSHERETLEAVIQARNTAQSASQTASMRPDDAAAIGALSVAEGALSGAMGRFFALAEAYPDLKANESMQQLMEELTTTENKISFARQHFNDAVTSYNNLREQFPNNLIGGMFSFAAAELLELESEEMRESPKISFN